MPRFDDAPKTAASSPSTKRAEAVDYIARNTKRVATYSDDLKAHRAALASAKEKRLQKVAEHKAAEEEKLAAQQLQVLALAADAGIRRAAHVWRCVVVQISAIKLLRVGLDQHRDIAHREAAANKICDFIYRNLIRRQMNALKKRCNNLVYTLG